MNLKAGYPFSLIRNGLVAEYPQLQRDLRTHVVVMGGGISGALTAWHLHRAGFDCVVVDARTIGLGSTCASTSLLQYEIDTPLHKLIEMIGRTNAERSYQLCADAVVKLGKISNTIGFKDFQFRNSFYYAAHKKDLDGLKKEFLVRKKMGLSLHYLDEKAVFEKTGLRAPAGLLSQLGAKTDAYMFTHALYRDACGKGLEVFDRTNITGIEHKSRSVELRTQNGYKIHAKKLVYATGYEVINYIDKPIVHLQSTYATISEPISKEKPFWKNDMIIWNTADPYLYIRSQGDRIMVGGRDENFYSPARRDKLIAAKTKKLAQDFNKLFPTISFVPEFTWTGTFGSTKDGLPFIGTYKKLPNSYFALGFGGNGITFSLVAAEIITSHLRGKRTNDESIFSFDRI